jgi:hypothetical protein
MNTNQLEATRANIVKQEILWLDVAMANVQNQVAELQRANLSKMNLTPSQSRSHFNQKITSDAMESKTQSVPYEKTVCMLHVRT